MIRFTGIEKVARRVGSQHQDVGHDLHGKGSPRLLQVSRYDGLEICLESLTQYGIVHRLPAADEWQPLVPRLEHSRQVADVQRRIVIEVDQHLLNGIAKYP